MFVEKNNPFKPNHTDLITDIRVPKGSLLLMKDPIFGVKNIDAYDKASLMLTRGEVENAVSVPYVMKDPNRVKGMLLEAADKFARGKLDPLSAVNLDAKEELKIEYVIMSMSEYKSHGTDYLLFDNTTKVVSRLPSFPVVVEEFELKENPSHRNPN